MSIMTLRSAAFEVGKTLTVGGVPKSNTTRFNMNIGPNETDIALHVDVRFNFGDSMKKVICNSSQGGVWGDEVVVEDFPFHEREQFKMNIKFSPAEFLVILPNDSTIHFPNRLGAEQYSVITVDDDVRITDISIN